jgi:hypothetical protein
VRFGKRRVKISHHEEGDEGDLELAGELAGGHGKG